jgi:type II secretory pathway component GspD/PulD (secretin)
MKKPCSIAFLVLFALAISAGAFAGDREDPQAVNAAKAPSPQRTELIKLKYLDAQTALNLLRAYQSPQGRVSPSGGRDNALIVVTDIPEIVEKMPTRVTIPCATTRSFATSATS